MGGHFCGLTLPDNLIGCIQNMYTPEHLHAGSQFDLRAAAFVVCAEGLPMTMPKILQDDAHAAQKRDKPISIDGQNSGAEFWPPSSESR
jgi:hypothetical protein